MTTDLDEQLTDALAPSDAPSDDELSAYYESLEDPDPEGELHPLPKPPFTVDGLGSADWAGRKIKRAQAAVDEAKAWRDRIVAEADAALARERERHEPTVTFFETLLADWLRREIEADTSKKPRASRDLPCGLTVKRISGKPSLEVEDADALVDWLKDHRPDLVSSEVVWNWSKNDVKKLADDEGRLAVVDEGSGEVVEAKGARIVLGNDSYRVVAKGGAA